MHFLTVALFGVLICNAVCIPFFKGTRSEEQCPPRPCFHLMQPPEHQDIGSIIQSGCRDGDKVKECINNSYDSYLSWTEQCARLTPFETKESHVNYEVQAFKFALDTVCPMPINETVRQIRCISTIGQSMNQCQNKTLTGKPFTRNDLNTRTSNTPAREAMCSYVDQLFDCATTVIANQCGQEGRSTTIANFVASNAFRQRYNYDGNCQTESEFEAALESFGLK